ncbi:hypothetical protein KEJ27_05090 [Candidatus Bathyarchaeota archaeon]|nr:hypothetical protein [Candidatus Bathyarchaeota archaeon]MBS7618674.1 hypothetical protein [Candidatus Bathyarchaeota archaeon]
MSLVNRFECVLATVLHEEPPVTPQVIDFTNEMARAKFLPIIEEGVRIVKEAEKAAYGLVSREFSSLDRVLKEADFMDNFIVGVGSGGFRVKRTVEASDESYVVEWETGALWRMGTAKRIWAREYIKYPIECEEDLEKLELPDPEDPERYEGVEKAIRYVVDRGFFPISSINGFFSGVWYFLRGPLEVTLKDIYIRRGFYKKLIAKIGEFNLKAEKNLLERGALMIGWVEDLGYNKGMFIHPKLYEELIYPWHRKAIELAHKHGAFVNMHSHGNINAIVPLLVEAKLDVLNPIGPSDNMDLKRLKEDYGDRLCLQGGLSKHMGYMSLEELRGHLFDRLRIGSSSGGFILSSEGDIPYEMNIENFREFLKMSRKYRVNRPLNW